jgi:hypothetical protein
MKKILSIIIIDLLIFYCFSVQGVFFKKTSDEITYTDICNLFFDKKMKLLKHFIHGNIKENIQ